LTIDSAVLPLDKMVAIKDACKSRTQSTDGHRSQKRNTVDSCQAVINVEHVDDI
jgi:hypothetical protein